jgi:predicted Rossmann-fold nucleotide-binding protein
MEGVEGTSAPNEKKGRFKRICVFCGSRPGYKSTFSDAALELGKVLVMCIQSFLIFGDFSCHSD